MKPFLASTLFAAVFGLVAISSVWAAKPNIVWIVIEDASPHIGCYGETLIKTPNIDKMAREGIRCRNAFVTSRFVLRAAQR